SDTAVGSSEQEGAGYPRDPSALPRLARVRTHKSPPFGVAAGCQPSGGKADIPEGPSWANRRHMNRSKTKYVHHSITSSASASSVGGISMPNALAVLRLVTR